MRPGTNEGARAASDFQAICGCCALEPASGEAAGVIHHGPHGVAVRIDAVAAEGVARVPGTDTNSVFRHVLRDSAGQVARAVHCGHAEVATDQRGITDAVRSKDIDRAMVSPLLLANVAVPTKDRMASRWRRWGHPNRVHAWTSGRLM